MKGRRQLLCHRTGLAVGDGAAVDLRHRHQLGAGAGDEALVGGVDVVAVQPHLLGIDARLGCQLQDGAAGDSLQGAVLGRRREQLTGANDEQVVGAAFGDEAGVVEQDGLVGAGSLRVDLGEDVLQVVQRFDSWIEGFM